MALSPPGPLSDDEVQALFHRANFLGGSVEMARALYADWAPHYEATLERFGRYLSPGRIAGLVAQHGRGSDARILDVACGTGWVGAELAARGHRQITGIDLSPDMLAEAARKGCYQRLVECDLAQFNPGDGFDVVVSAGVLTMGHQGANAFDRMVRALVPGGLIVTDVEEGTFQKDGFVALLERLEAEGALNVVTLCEGHFYEAAADEPPHGRFLAARRL